jgi:hypothetical protein
MSSLRDIRLLRRQGKNREHFSGYPQPASPTPALVCHPEIFRETTNPSRPPVFGMTRSLLPRGAARRRRRQSCGLGCVCAMSRCGVATPAPPDRFAPRSRREGPSASATRSAP